MLKLDTMASMNYFLNIAFTMQGLKNPLVRGPGAFSGFGPNNSNPVKSDVPVETVQLRT